MRYKILKYNQNSQEYISTVIPFSVIDKMSKVLVYDIDEDGYQRTPNKLHYSKIKKYIIEKKEDYKFPTSIILGVDKNEIDNYLEADQCGDYLNLNSDKIIFRIVDGQHRIYGLREASKLNPTVNDLLLNVIILITEENKKITELEVFNDINSTAKRISTDLSILAKFKFKIKDENLRIEDVPEFISINTAYKLKEFKENTVWSSGIKFDIHSEITLGIVGVTSFSESIQQIVTQLLEKKFNFNDNKHLKGKELIDYCEEVSLKIAEEINELWYKIIFKKWKLCFEHKIIKDEFGEIKDTFYNESFYIQKTIGVKVLNVLYSEILKGLESEDIDLAKSKFDDLISNSKFTSNFWKKGGILSGLSSESGFSKARAMIREKGTNIQSELF